MFSNWLEILGFLTGLIGVWLSIRQSVWCWPVAIVNVGLYFFVFLNNQLYGDMALQVFFAIVSVYGWYFWLKGGANHQTALVSQLQPKNQVIQVLLLLISTALLGFFLRYETNASFPWLDSFCTIGSVIAQFLQARKKLENWLIWIAVDIIYTGIYLYKELYLTAALYAFFIWLAFIGFSSWKTEFNADVQNV